MELKPNRKSRRAEAATFKRFSNLVRKLQRIAKVSEATMVQLVKDGSLTGLVHDTFRAGHITAGERSFMLKRMGVGQ